MSLKRAVAVALMALLVMGMVAGCGQKPPEQPKPAEQKPAEQPKPEPPKKLKVGLVFDVGGRGDKSFNDMAYAGLEKAGKEFADKIETKYLEPSAGGENREQLLRLLAEDKYDLIFGVGFLFTDHIAKVA
ncbi:MAG: BMP family ABC transporter substrate-binding protein, partial [Bacillota bacterium]